VEAAVASLGRGDVRRAAGERDTYRAAATGCAVGPAGADSRIRHGRYGGRFYFKKKKIRRAAPARAVAGPGAGRCLAKAVGGGGLGCAAPVRARGVVTDEWTDGEDRAGWEEETNETEREVAVSTSSMDGDSG